MAKIIAWLSGKKVYILAVLGALAGIVQFIAAGHFDLNSWIGLGQTEWFMAITAAFRAAVAKSGPTTPTA